jgi:hypothetical protein
MDPMAKATPATDVGAAADTLRDGARAPGGDAATAVKVDVKKVLDRIAAALAALDDGRVPRRARPLTKPDQPVSVRPRLRHNWG